MPRFTDQVLLITGAGSGIGRAATLKLAAEGANVFATDVVAEGLEETVKSASEAAAAVASSRSKRPFVDLRRDRAALQAASDSRGRQMPMTAFAPLAVARFTESAEL